MGRKPLCVRGDVAQSCNTCPKSARAPAPVTGGSAIIAAMDLRDRDNPARTRPRQKSRTDPMRRSDHGGILPLYPLSSGPMPLRLALGAILFLGACAAGPNYQPPEMLLPAQFSRHVAAPAVPGTADRLWWEDFHDPVLNHLVAAALAGSPTLAEARARLAEAEALRSEERRVGKEC